MKKNYLIFLWCCPLFLFGQAQQHFFSGHFSVGAGYYLDKNIEIGTNEQPERSYGLAWNYNYEFHRKWRILTGLAYTAKKFTTVFNDLNVGVEFDPQTGTFINDPSLPSSMRFQEKRHSIEIPVGLKWLIVKRKCTFFVATGLGGNILLGSFQKQTLNFDDGSNRVTQTFNFAISNIISNTSLRSVNTHPIWNVSPFFRCGIDIPIFKTKKLLIEPRIKYTRLDWFSALSIVGFRDELVNIDIALGFQF